MRTFEIPYGQGHLPLYVPERLLLGVLQPRSPGNISRDERALVSEALRSPINAPPLWELSKEKRRILVITSDHTRPMPSRVTMPLLLEQLRLGNPSADIRILIGTGTHRPMREDEMRQRFGNRIADEETLINHVCDDKDALVYKGLLPSGGELWVNDLVDWADLLVAEGFVEPHFFAGFSGGRKSVLPAIAGRQSILYNHCAAFIGDPLSRQGSLAGNLLHRDMLAAANSAGLSFILNVLLDAQKRIVAAYAGDPGTAHERACMNCLARTGVNRVKADIAITSNGGYPLDQNVYQAVKGMTAAEACVRRGGVIILCAALGDGAGGEGFFRLVSEAASPAALLASIGRTPPERTREDQWEAQILARVMAHATVIFVTGQENQALIQAMGMKWAADPNIALNMAHELLDPEASIVVIPDGPGVIVLDR